jgi:hypothetical protein
MGYSSSTLYPKQYQTISVPIFKNNSSSKNMEFMLTDALIKEIEARTPYHVIGKEYADTQFTGTIRSVDLHTISQSRLTGLDDEVMITVSIDFEWINLKSGNRIVGRKNFTNSALFVPSQPSSEPIEIGKFAVIQQLSKDIVDQMQASW